MVSVDHVDHEALAAVSASDGEPVGVVRYVRTDDRAAAEVAATVVDAWQGRGVATELFLRLAERARANGIDRFTAFVLPANEEIVEVLRRIGRVTVEGVEAGVLSLEVELDRPDLHAPLRRLLRAAASGELRT